MEIEVWNRKTSEGHGVDEEGQLMVWDANREMVRLQTGQHDTMGNEGRGGSNLDNEEDVPMILIIHHPNLNKLLQKRQALRGQQLYGSTQNAIPRREGGRSIRGKEEE